MDNFSHNIRTLRKKSNLTQDALAEMVGVSNSAISKWELGTSLPDTSILPSLAKALNTDLNSLFSFREKLSRKDISSLTNNVKKILISKEYNSAVKLANEYFVEYPKEEELQLNISSQLLMFAGYDEPDSGEFSDRITYIIPILQNLVNSSEPSIVNQSKFVLSQAYSNLENYSKSKDLLIDLAKSSLDTDIPILSLLLKDDSNKEFIESSSLMLWQGVNKVISILDLTSAYLKDKPNEALKYTNISIELMNVFNSTINFAYYNKCKLLYSLSKFEESAKAFKDFVISLTTFPISYSKHNLFNNVKLSLDEDDQTVNRKNLVNLYLLEDFPELESIKDYKDSIQMLKDFG